MGSLIDRLKIQSKEQISEYKPSFFKLSMPADKNRLEKLFKEYPPAFIHDEINGQIEELVKSQNPKIVYTKSQLSEAAKNHLGDTPSEEYGVWVYYPWSRRLVHILEEEEFIEVRTNRNQYKITPDENRILSKKRIGVIGLSVGQSVSITMTLERIYGEIRIADHDILELSNLNRIRTGIHNLGIKKTIAVAREIAEIDPYLKVVCYHDGVTEDSIDNFFQEDGKLDLVVDECDNLYIKILSRHQAKKLNIPVIMEASDRGTIDVERFDLEPNRPILHGFIDHLDLSKVKFLKTNEEKVPFLLPIAGIETISKKAKASMMEVGQSITTWPQLASAVALGGGITTDICRRIILNEFHDSGRYFIDVEELVCNKVSKAIQDHSLKLKNALTNEEILSLIKEDKSEIYKDQIEVKEDIIKTLVSAAILAPSGANAQPWTWRYHKKNLYLFFDIVYIAQLLDFKGTTSYIGLGTATENLILKAHEVGLEVVVEKFPIKENDKLIAVFKFFNKTVDTQKIVVESHECDFLAAAIETRITNRKITPKLPIESKILSDLEQIAKTIPGASLKFITDEPQLLILSEIIAKVDRIRVMHEGGHMDFMAEMRWTKEQSEFMRNGVDVNSIDLTPSELAGFQMAKDWGAISLLNNWNKGTALEKFSRKTALSASAIGLITMPGFSPLDFYEGGRSVERVWLAATQKNIAFQPVTIATLIFNTFLYEKNTLFPKEMYEELRLLREQFINVFSINKQIGEILLFRIFVASPPDIEKKSLRVPIEQVLSFI